MIQVQFSFHLEQLLQSLQALILKRSDPLRPFRIAISSLGSTAWIEEALMKERGVVANVQWCTPLADLLGRSGYVPASALFAQGWDREAFIQELTAHLARFLIDEPDLLPEPLTHHFAGAGITGESADVRPLQFALSFSQWIAQELEYDPRRLAQWAEGSERVPGAGSWQAALWCRMVEKMGWRRLLERTPLRLLDFRPARTFADVPIVVILLGSPLAPYQLTGYEQLSQKCLTYFFNWNLIGPVHNKEEFGDINQSHGRFQSQFLQTHQQQWHQFSRFSHTISSADLFPKLKTNPRGSALNHLYQYCLQAKRGSASPQRLLEIDRCTLRIRRAPSILREVESARDWILEKLSQDGELQPKDFAIIVPDLERYAPFLLSIFSFSRPGPKIALSLSSAWQRQQRQLFEYFLNFLRIWSQEEMDPSEFCAALQALQGWRGFFETPDRFDRLCLAQLESATAWTSTHVPPRRLLEEWRKKILQKFQYHIEKGPGVDSTILEHYHHFLELLDVWKKFWLASSTPRALHEWEQWFLEQLPLLFDGRSRLYQMLSQQLGIWFALRTENDPSNILGPVTYEAAMVWLSSRLPSLYRSSLSRTKNCVATFSSTEHYRGVPFQHILLLGQNQGSDACLLADYHYQLEHGSERTRILQEVAASQLVERCLSARQSLYFSFLMDGEEGSQRPNEAVISLLSAVYQIQEGDDRFISPLPSLPSDPDNFKDEQGWRSYAAEWFSVPAEEEECRIKSSLSLAAPLSPAHRTDPSVNVSLKELACFFENPILHWMSTQHQARLNRLGPGHALTHQERNRLLCHRRRRQLFDLLWQERTGGKLEPQILLQHTKSQGWLPEDLWGDQMGQIELEQLAALVEQAHALGYARKELWLQWRGCEGILYALGEHQHLAGGAFALLFSRTRVKDLFKTWLIHLLRSVQTLQPTSSILLSYNQDLYEFAAMDPQFAHTLLESYFSYFIQNSRAVKPLPFFVESAGAWVKTFLEEQEFLGATGDPLQPQRASEFASLAAWKAFRNVWEGGFQSRGESLRLGFHLAPALELMNHPEMEKMMLDILKPMYRHLTHREGLENGTGSTRYAHQA